MTPTIWTTSHPINEVVCAALQKGTGYPRRHVSLYQKPVVSIIHGILRGSDTVIKGCWKEGIDFWHVDNGYLRANHFDGYYRISRNNLQAEYNNITELPGDRFLELKLSIAPYHKSGKYILLCPPTEAMQEFWGDDAVSWQARTIDKLAKITNRPLKVREKTDPEPLTDALKNTWCVVTYNSNVAVQALLKGVPAIATNKSVVHSWNKCELGDVESNKLFEADRRLFMNFLAYQQWTLKEIEQGLWKN